MRLRELIVAIKVRADIKGATAVEKVIDQIAKAAKIAESSLTKVAKATGKLDTAASSTAKSTRAASKGLDAMAKSAARAEVASEKAANAADKASRKAAQLGRAGRGGDGPEFSKAAGGARQAVGGVAGGVGRFIAAGAVLGGLSLGVAAEFESIEVQIEKLWGSKPKADAVFAGIKEFAARTPFDLQQVTSSFVDFKIRGIEPTQDEMTALGDLASTFKNQGGSLGDLTGAMAAMLRGENDPIEKYGISAKASGDKVILSFGDQKIAVDKTMESIKAAMVQFGQTDGIAGAMAVQMTTLGGAWSNFQDAVSVSIAEAMTSSGAMEEAKGLLGDLTGKAGDASGAFGEVLVSALRDLRAWLQTLTREQIREWLDRAVESAKSMVSMTVELVAGLLELVGAAREVINGLDETGQMAEVLTLALGALMLAGGGLAGIFAAAGVAAIKMGMDAADAAGSVTEAVNRMIDTVKRARMMGLMSQVGPESTAEESGESFGEVSSSDVDFKAAAEANRKGLGEEFLATADQQLVDLGLETAIDPKDLAARSKRMEARQGYSAEETLGALAPAGSKLGVKREAAKLLDKLDAAVEADLRKTKDKAKSRDLSDSEIETIVASRRTELNTRREKAAKTFTKSFRTTGNTDKAIETALDDLDDPKKKGAKGKSKKDKKKDLLETLGLKGPGSILDSRPTPAALTIQTTIIAHAAERIDVHVTLPAGSTLGRSADQVGTEVGQAIEQTAREMIVEIAQDAWALNWTKLGQARGGGRVPKHVRRAGA